MRRLLLVLVGVLVIGGVAAGWWLTRSRPASTVVVGGLGWTRLTPDGGPVAGGAEVYAVTADPGGSGFVAVGKAGDRAGVWRSTDGRAWQPVADPGLAASRRQVWYGVAGFPGGLVAVGTQFCDDTRSVGVAWLAAGGRGWAQVGLPGQEGGCQRVRPESGSIVQGVTVDGARLVAVGGERVRGQARPAAWSSADGRAWDRVDLGVVGQARGMLGAVAATPRGLLAAGTAGVALAEGGAGWRLLPDVASGGAEPEGVGWDGARLVVTGQDRDKAGAVWTSADGRDWQRAPIGQDGQDGAEATVSDVVAAAGKVVAVGRTTNLDPDRNPVVTALVWVQADGQSWSAPPTGRASEAVLGGSADHSARMYAAAAGNGQVVAVGSTNDSDGNGTQAGFWLGTPA